MPEIKTEFLFTIASSEKYGWMNRICSIATGARAASGRTFQVFQVL